MKQKSLLHLRRHGEQRRRYYAEAAGRRWKTGETLRQILEPRLDNVIYRTGLAPTRRAARQLATHGHFLVNGVRFDVPPYRVSKHDIVSVRPKSVSTRPIEPARQTQGDRPVPAWMQVIPDTLQVLIHQLPIRGQIDTILAEQLIVELYSKK